MRKNIRTLWIILGGLGSLAGSCYAQGFINLNFESASVQNLPPNQFEQVSAASGLPGWMVYYGTNQVSQIGHNNETVGSVNVSILGPSYYSNAVFAGQYTAILQNGQGNHGEIISASIAQTGFVPDSMQAVQFLTSARIEPNSFSVSMDGQVIPLYLLAETGSLRLYGGDISGFAGRTANLRFTSVPDPAFSPFYLDNISFRLTPIPEPQTYTLVLCGAVLFGLRRSKKR